jgi:ankyrin repeat protein
MLIRHAAVSWDYLELATLLMDKYGASITVRDEDGDTPLHACCSPAMAEMLMKRGADPMAVNHAGWVPMQSAFVNGEMEMVEFMKRNMLVR